MLQFVHENCLFGVVPMLDNRHDQLLEIVVPLFTDVFLLDQANQLGVRPFKVAPEPVAFAANARVQSIIVDDSIFCDVGPARLVVLRRRLLNNSIVPPGTRRLRSKGQPESFGMPQDRWLDRPL